MHKLGAKCLLILSGLCCVAFTSCVTTVPSPDTLKAQDKEFAISVRKEIPAFRELDIALRYDLKSKDCRFSWHMSRKRSNRKVRMRLSYPQPCPLSFSEQKKYHAVLLQRIFTKWKPEDVYVLRIGSLFQLDSSGNFSARVAKASVESSRELSSGSNLGAGSEEANQRFVEILNNEEPLNEFVSLLSSFDLELKLAAVDGISHHKGWLSRFPASFYARGVIEKSKKPYSYDADLFTFDVGER